MTENKKVCNKCNELKDITEFHKRAAYKDGFNGKCKKCIAEYYNAYRIKNRDILNARKYWKHEKYYNAKKHKEKYKKMRQKDGYKDNARKYLRHKVKTRKLIKPKHCEYPKCKNTKLHGHHYLGYEKENWYKIKWLCPKHHALADKCFKLFIKLKVVSNNEDASSKNKQSYPYIHLPR